MVVFTRANKYPSQTSRAMLQCTQGIVCSGWLTRWPKWWTVQNVRICATWTNFRCWGTWRRNTGGRSGRTLLVELLSAGFVKRRFPWSTSKNILTPTNWRSISWWTNCFFECAIYIVCFLFFGEILLVPLHGSMEYPFACHTSDRLWCISSLTLSAQKSC